MEDMEDTEEDISRSSSAWPPAEAGVAPADHPGRTMTATDTHTPSSSTTHDRSTLFSHKYYYYYNRSTALHRVRQNKVAP